ncbi:nuclear transport factor 2 family protein [Pseudoalteromonas sp. H105]|jgi:hypothetical protein|uniref:nuclear transport factor 2 family protein n=1 Tax=Pseudoalteromonas sp. H105 TaxID=1348393 RepID=UPI00073231C1|nr:nuclear transport factor 2 family protein [Pseudoalteromonas sp. H105]KTF17012.1 hypothetical protein ATS75_06105 [Pseudoalteromonas sp. H105]
MKSLFFAMSLLFSGSLLAVDAEQTTKPAKAPQQKTETKNSDAVEPQKALEDSPAVITLTPEKAPPEIAVDIEPTQPIVSDARTANKVDVVDSSKVLGAQTVKPTDAPKTQQEKEQAIAKATQVVAQAKEALTQKQQEKAKQSREALAVVEKLIKAYNSRNIEAFVSMYSEDVEFYVFPNELLFKGKENLIARYGIMFKKLKCVKSSPIKRIVTGNIVIDHELSETCTTDPNVVDKRSEFVSSYKVENGKVTKVLFFK